MDPADTQVTRHGLLYTLGWAQLILDVRQHPKHLSAHYLLLRPCYSTLFSCLLISALTVPKKLGPQLSSYKKLIEEYCKQHEVLIPAGFYRLSACQFAIIRLDKSPSKLIALTWFKKTDLLYFLKNQLQSEFEDPENMNSAIKIIDFKSKTLFNYIDGKLITIGPLD